MRPHNPATMFWPPSATVVSAESFSHGTGTLRCLQKEMATYRHWSVSLWRDPDDVPHCWILSPDKTEWQLILATLCGWRRCLVADQFWFMTRIREEEEEVRWYLVSSVTDTYLLYLLYFGVFLVMSKHSCCSCRVLATTLIIVVLQTHIKKCRSVPVNIHEHPVGIYRVRHNYRTP